MAKEIELSNGMVALVDDEDFERVNSLKWHARRNKDGSFYAVRNSFGKKLFLHNFILNRLWVDHINRNKLDNRKCNLRACNRSQNKANTTKYKNNKSGYKGVRVCNGRFRSEIRVNNKHVSIGYFDNPEAAARAYDAKARELFGEFARCNFED